MPNRVCIELIEQKDVESVKNRVSRFAMRFKLLLRDDTTDCLYRIGEKSDLNSTFNTSDIFSFDIFYFRYFFFRPTLYQSLIESTIKRDPICNGIKEQKVNIRFKIRNLFV